MCQSGGHCLQNVHSRLRKTNRTALHVAARNGRDDCIDVLIKEGANIEAEDKDHKTAIGLAAWKWHCDVIKTLIKLGANRVTAGKKYYQNIDKCVKGKKVHAIKCT